MSYEEEFDRLMRDKAGEMQYAFEEAHWQKASELISRSRGGAIRFKALVIGGAVVVGLGISVLIYTNALPEEKTQVATTVTLPPQAQQQIDVPTSPAAEVNPAPSQAETVASASKSSGAPLVSAVAPVPVEALPPATVETESPAATAKMSSADDAGITASTEQTSGAGNIDISRVNKKESGTSTPPEQTPVSSTGAEFLPSPDNAEAHSENTTALAEVSTEQLQGRSLFLAYHSTDLDVIVRPVTEVTMKDDDYYKAGKKPRVFYADLIGGGAYNLGWEKRGKQDGKGLNWYGGINAGVFICRRLSIGTGFQAFNLANITQPFHVVRATDYDFASATSKTVITCSQLQYFGVPLKFTWHSEGAELSFGILGAQLWRAHNTLESTVTRDASVIASDKSTNHNLYEGMTQQVLMLNAGCSVNLSRRLFVGAELIYGLTDLYSGSSYYASGREVPAAIRLGITYRLMEK